MGPLSTAAEGTHVAHNTSGLPPLNLEPFDPSDLYAAARSNTTAAAQPRRSRVRPLVMGLALVAALVAGAALLVT